MKSVLNVWMNGECMPDFLQMKQVGCRILGALMVLGLPVVAWAAGGNTGDGGSWTFVMIGVFGGLAFFLYGMELMSDGMKRAAGASMRDVLARMTKNRVRGMFVGTFVTMMVQSSSATTVMLVGFVQSELLRFSQTLGVILGAGIGSTFTAQLIAFKLTDYALLMVGAGFLLKMAAKSDKATYTSQILLGFGILFYGMKLMSDAMVPLRTDPAVLEMLQSLANPATGILVGIGITALIQSSGAVVGILIVLADQGLMGLDVAIPLILGSNVGTCVTAILASIGTSRESKRVAAAHTLFRLAGVLVFAPFLTPFGEALLVVGGGIGRQIANAHTFFNIVVAFAFLPFTDLFARCIEKIVPEREGAEALPEFASPLVRARIVAPDVAVELARNEISRMADILQTMFVSMAIPFVSSRPRQDREFPQLTLLEGVERREEEIDFLERTISDFLFRVARENVSGTQTQSIYAMISIVKDLESIGDLVERNAIPLLAKKNLLKRDFSDEGKEELGIYHQKVVKQLRLLKEAFAERDLEKAARIMGKERKYLDLELQYRIRHLNRIICKRIESVETHEVHMELMNIMTQVIVYTSNIAKTYLAAVDARKSG